MSDFFLYNTLTRKKEKFEPLHPPFVGIYVCGPTVYNDAHVGNGRPAVIFDVLRRYLTFLGYKVRFVRNITDVGHLLGEAEEGEDRISKQAKLEQLEPMELVQRYTIRYHQVMEQLNVLRPDIEPTATGHILEQIRIVQSIVEQGFGYEVNGSVYFDVPQYQKQFNTYGELSGRVVEELIAGAGQERRTLESQEEKRHPSDFALWKKAQPEHIMRWPSPWGEGFPGWHLECTAMSHKYLGETFDIHGGGMDLMFPHHECEIAQAKAYHGHSPVKYWMHNNMITVGSQKMSKSLGNFISLDNLFTGQHPMLSQPYSPMVVRLFILQAQYRSTMDFSDEALKATKKNYKKLINGLKALKKMTYPDQTTTSFDESLENDIKKDFEKFFAALNDDLNTALALTQLLNLLKKINILQTQPEKIATIRLEVFKQLQEGFVEIFEQILGLTEEKPAGQEALLESILKIYQEAKQNKEYGKVDAIRADLKAAGIAVKDMKQGVDWAYLED